MSLSLRFVWQAWSFAAAATFGLCSIDELRAAEIPSVTQAMQAFVDQGEIAGAVTIVVGREGILHESAVGWSNREQHQPMQMNNLFWIASMTKPITGLAVCLLHAEGKLSIDDPVSKHLPEFKDLKDTSGQHVNVTITQLLTHTSGLSDLPSARENEVKSLKELVSLVVKLPVRFEPGSQWSYCQSSINTAARIVEVVAGVPFEEFLEKRIFGPLGMVDTTFYLSPEQLPRLATSYRRTEQGLVATDVFVLGGKSPTSRDRYPRANGGLFSTAHDYARLCQMLLNNGDFAGQRVIPADAIALMTRIHSGDLITGFTPGNGWGIGCCVVRDPQGVTSMLSPGSYGHGGAYGTQAWIDPVQGKAVVLMVQRANFPNADASEVRRVFQETVFATKP